MTPKTPKTPKTISGKGRENDSGNSGNSIVTGIPEFPRNPEKNLIRILLSKAASDALTATGEQAFAIVHRAMRGVEEPDTAGRWCITLAPVEWETAQAASRVLLCEMRAVPIRKLKNLTKPDIETEGTTSQP